MGTPAPVVKAGQAMLLLLSCLLASLAQSLAGECWVDSECPDPLECRAGWCGDPCAVSGVCGDQARCMSTQHQAVCACPAGYTGLATVECHALPPLPLVLQLQCSQTLKNDSLTYIYLSNYPYLS